MPAYYILTFEEIEDEEGEYVPGQIHKPFCCRDGELQRNDAVPLYIWNRACEIIPVECGNTSVCASSDFR